MPNPSHQPAPSRVVLITGASSGIGHATAARLVQAGWPVYATARDPKPLQDLRDLGCRTLALDVTDEASMEAVVAQIERDHGAVGVLINNAGYSQSGAVERVTGEQWRRQLETNLVGPMLLMQRVLPAMRAQGWGKIVNVSSMGGQIVLPGGGAYHASKHALEAASDAARFELACFGVDVVIIQPGLIRTDFGEAIARNLEPADEGDAYGAFEQEVETLSRESYHEKPMTYLTRPPEAVAKVIQKAIEARRPRTRYEVSPAAYLFMSLHRWLPDRLWDVFVGSFYPRPGAG